MARFVSHLTPTSASWLNAVEGLFALLAKRRLTRGVFRSLQELKDAIHSFIANTNANPKPFIWTKRPRPDRIAAAKRGQQPFDRFRAISPSATVRAVTEFNWEISAKPIPS
jgi:hypothetical protein